MILAFKLPPDDFDSNHNMLLEKEMRRVGVMGTRVGAGAVWEWSENRNIATVHAVSRRTSSGRGGEGVGSF